jgi:SPX domain protein involved in polyphosphate accumulation
MKNNFRFERKWVFKDIDKETLLLSLLNSKFFFIEQFNERVVNSIYFDTLSLKSAVDNLDGINDREKHRVRWYGEDTGTLIFPILENKIKKNFQGYKILYKLNKFNKKKLSNDTLSNLTEDINKLLPLKNLQPVSMTSYRRVYLISADKRIRATLDFDLKYKKMINYVEKFFINTDDLILEFKYSSNLDSYLRNLTPGITRLSKNSKYINSLLTSNSY